MDGPACPKCGHRNETGANFCSSCGNDLRDLHGEATGQIPAVLVDANHEEFLRPEFDSDSPYLIVRHGPMKGARFALDAGAVSAGRHPDSDIFLDDVTVSRRHAEFEPSPTGTVVRDVGSLNGTYVNRQLVDSDVRLSDGDEVQIGKFKLVYLDHEPDVHA